MDIPGVFVRTSLVYLLLWLVLISPQFWVAYTTAVKTVTCDPRIFRADKRWETQFGTSIWPEQDNPGQSFFFWFLTKTNYS